MDDFTEFFAKHFRRVEPESATSLDEDPAGPMTAPAFDPVGYGDRIPAGVRRERQGGGGFMPGDLVPGTETT